LGNALLAQKKYNEAANVFREDLKLHPNNYIATKGLKNTMHQNKKN
jgi:TolA-binding protein